MTSSTHTSSLPPRLPGDARLRALCLAALGVVFADIGTSPLYAIRECFRGPAAVSLTEAHVLGVLSLVIWSLLFLVSFMYLTLILRADNEGEGGVLALATLISRKQSRLSEAGRRRILMVGLFGAALLYGDGLLTPAISVLSAVEGLDVWTPRFAGWVVPITILILVGLFAIQWRGTAAVGALFGPITLVWFVSIGLMGLVQILQMPGILRAFDPRWGLALLKEGDARGIYILGPVFLVITGAETLYADLGHFGRRPIQLTWNFLVLPALLLNYLGQGALLLKDPGAAVNPFYHLAPVWLLLPLVLLASAATVIASQGNISEVFSLTRQGVLLGYLPRVEIRHTSEEEIGQVYLPAVNWALLAATIGLVMGFGSSSKLAGAYGVNVATTVMVTSFLSFFAMRDLWGFRTWLAMLVSGVFMAVAGLFFFANVAKVLEFGWLPLSIGIGVYLLMTTWKRGRLMLLERLRARSQVDMDLESALAEVSFRVPGTAVYLTGLSSSLPPALVQNLRLNRCLHERVIFFTFVAEPRAYVPEAEQIEVTELGRGVSRVLARHGFMEKPHLADYLKRLPGTPVDPSAVVYVLGRETLVPGGVSGLSVWRRGLFHLMSRNATMATAFYGLPPERVLELGIQVEI